MDNYRNRSKKKVQQTNKEKIDRNSQRNIKDKEDKGYKKGLKDEIITVSTTLEEIRLN